MPEYVAYMNGEWVPDSQLKIDRKDRGFRTADVVFDVLRTYNGKLFQKERHLDRYYRSMQYTRIDSGLSKEEMGDVFEEVVERNSHLLAEEGDFYVWPFVTRGPGRWASAAGPPTVIVEAFRLDFYRYARFFESGAHGVIPKTRSSSHQSMDPKVKHHSRMNFNMAELEVADVDPDAYPVLTDYQGNLTEGTINSFFLVTDGVIRTPGDSDILQSVSRGTVMDLAGQLGISVVQEELQPYDLYTADEAFLSYTGPGILPMTQVDTREIGDGKPGPITNQLLAAWSEKVGFDVVDQALRFAGDG